MKIKLGQTKKTNAVQVLCITIEEIELHKSRNNTEIKIT
jgi:hypothetical protein